MSSTFTWLDHSDTERRKVLEAIDRFKETDTRDELGIAPIRDALSDLFFPGTGVLMTRARYFLFVPWMYLELERKGFRDDVEIRGRRAEVQIIETLGDELGAIGKLAKGTLKRLPSSIYWLGLSTWGIRTFQGSHADYHRFLETGANRIAREARDDDGEPVGEGIARSWHGGLPRAPADFPKRATLELTRLEAVYLRERIRLSTPGSMLALLLRSGELPDVAYPWMHPRFADFPQEVRHALSHAQCFAETMQGAAILYNLMLAEADERDSVEDFRSRLAAWSEELRGRKHELRSWHIGDFWQLARSIANVHPKTFEFVNRWLELTAWESPEKACDDRTARELVRVRELQLKRARARLGNPRALELWGGDSGTGRLVYRWPTGRRLVGDILEGLERRTVPATGSEVARA
jgi:Family of unknown function (DUF6361)